MTLDAAQCPFSPQPLRTVEYVTKQTLVVLTSDHQVHRRPAAHRACPPAAFFIDTDAERVVFVDWLVTTLTTDSPNEFEDALEFRGLIVEFPTDGSRALYFESRYTYGPCEKEFYERVFRIDTVADKLALFELILAGELHEIFGGYGDGGGLRFKTVKARVAIDTTKAVVTLCEATQLPLELAEKIVASTVSEGEFC